MNLWRTCFTTWILVTLLAVTSLASAQVKPEVLLRAAVETETVKGDLKGAIKQYADIVSKYRKTDRTVAAEALLRMGQCHEKLGSAEARAAYEELLRDFPDQAERVQLARQRLNALDSSQPTGPVARRLSSGLYVRAVSPDERYVVYLDNSANFRLKDLRTEKDTPITKDTFEANWSFTYAPVAISRTASSSPTLGRQETQTSSAFPRSMDQECGRCIVQRTRPSPSWPGPGRRTGRSWSWWRQVTVGLPTAGLCWTSVTGR